MLLLLQHLASDSTIQASLFEWGQIIRESSSTWLDLVGGIGELELDKLLKLKYRAQNLSWDQSLEETNWRHVELSRELARNKSQI